MIRGLYPRDIRDAGLVALIKVAASAIVLATGFRAVSDDDFARVVIAQIWAHAPRLDPSGTSWLPFPFWLQGSVLAMAGAGLDVARATSLALGVASALLVYIVARWITRDRAGALLGAALAAVFPWSARLGVATVPELPTAALVLVALGSLVAGDDDRPVASRRLAGGAALFAATLSRYEPWPIAIGFALYTMLDARRARRGDRALLFAAGALAIAGPAAWVAWNHHAHGDALHFVTRVAAFKKALGGGDESASARLVAYPVALVREEPELFAALGVLLALALCFRVATLRQRLARFARPAALALAQIAALSAAMVKDGAPTHHPERAVLVAMLLGALIAGDLAATLLRTPGARGATVAASALAVLVAAFVIRPRITAHEGFTPRAQEVAIGRAARARMAKGDRLLVEVVDYGHLAIVAALGRPEDAVLDRSLDPREPHVASSFDGAAELTARLAAANASWTIARPSVVTRHVLGEPLEIAGAWALFGAHP